MFKIFWTLLWLYCRFGFRDHFLVAITWLGMTCIILDWHIYLATMSSSHFFPIVINELPVKSSYTLCPRGQTQNKNKKICCIYLIEICASNIIFLSFHKIMTTICQKKRESKTTEGQCYTHRQNKSITQPNFPAQVPKSIATTPHEKQHGTISIIKCFKHLGCEAKLRTP